MISKAKKFFDYLHKYGYSYATNEASRETYTGIINMLSSIFPTLPILWAHIGSECRISRSAKINNSRLIELGDRVFIGDYVTLDAKSGNIIIGNDTSILPLSLLMTYGGEIRIGSHCSVNPFCVLYGLGGLEIGNNVRIATHTVIVPANHKFDNTDVLIRQQGSDQKGVIINDDVWIGAGVRILDGVTVGQGSVVAAGAVVTKDIPPYAIVAGVPAHVIRWRKREELNDT